MELPEKSLANLMRSWVSTYQYIENIGDGSDDISEHEPTDEEFKAHEDEFQDQDDTTSDYTTSDEEEANRHWQWQRLCLAREDALMDVVCKDNQFILNYIQNTTPWSQNLEFIKYWYGVCPKIVLNNQIN